MRILQVNQFCGHVGGTEVYVDLISEELVKRGHHVSLLCEESGNFEVKRHYAIHQIPGISLWSFRRRNEVIAEVSRIVESENPDLINLHNIHNSWVTEQFLRMRPTLRYLHDHRLFCPRGKYYLCGTTCSRPFGMRCLFNSYVPLMCYGYFTKKPWRVWRDYRSFDRTLRANMGLEKLIVASRFMKECLVQNGFNEEMVKVLPYFTDPPVETGSVGDSILYVGRLLPEKGLHILLDALSLLPDHAKLVVVGDGLRQYESLLDRQVSRLGLKSRVHLAGRVRHGELKTFYEACRLAVVPSLWPEPFGIVGIEALSHGRPVVAFDSGGISDWLIDGEVGFLVPRGDVKGLAARIQQLLESPERAESMGKKGRSIVAERFSREVHVEELLKLYEKIC